LSIPEQIRALERLAQIDADLKELTDQLAQERSTLDGLKSGIAKLDEKLTTDRAALVAMDKTRGELIQDVRNMNQQLEHSREKLGRSRTEREANAAQRELEELADELGAREGDIHSKLGEVDGLAQAKRTERDAAAKQLPPQLYRRYDMIRSKRGTAIAKTSDGTCQACHMALPPQLFHRLRREPTLDQCPSCNRIIYFASPAAAGAPARS
jgi:predicted  nucleic acid-binding Zn-ribbon protein